MVRISGISNKIFSSKPVKNIIKFASDNPVLFSAATTAVFSTVVRPSVIWVTPNSDKSDKKYAISKSLASSAVGLGLSYAVSKPIETAIKKIDKNPEKFLKPETIKNFTENNKPLLSSKKYLFSTQIFKTSIGFLTALPKSMLTCAIIPVIANKFDDNKDKISFGRKDSLAKSIGNGLNSQFIQKFTNKFSNTNLVQNTSIATDLLLTGSFINRIKKSKDIPDDNKKPLIHNSLFSTGLSIATSFGLNKLSDNPTEKFINYFLNINKDIKNPQKYAQGIKTIKTILVMGGVYYAVIPFISTFLSSAIKKQNKTPQI